VLIEDSKGRIALNPYQAIVIVFLVLAAQFDSFLHPVTIMVAVVLSFTGALLMLQLTGDTLNLFSQIGLVMLIGLETKNAILIIEFAASLREQGRSIIDSAKEASRLRLRPILMTTAMLVAAMIPMTLSNGPGSGTRASMSKVILGGQALSLVLTLLVTPVVYSLFDSIGQWLSRPRA